MPKSDSNHFVVKHDLDSLQKLPNFVWRTNKRRDDRPHRFGQVKAGDRWVAFAYTSSDLQERPLSLVTGFFECSKEAVYRPVPKGLDLSIYDWEEKGYAWMIEGKMCGRQPQHPVGVPPLADLLRRPLWNNQAIVPITADDFDLIQEYTFSHEFDSSMIPLIGREPECEQELLAVVIHSHSDLGINKIHRVRKAFPDLLVEIGGSPKEVHLELELYSSGVFCSRPRQARPQRTLQRGRKAGGCPLLDRQR